MGRLEKWPPPRSCDWSPSLGRSSSRSWLAGTRHREPISMGEAAEGKSGSCSPEQAASLPAGSGIPGRRGVLGSPARFSRVHGGFRVGGSGASYFSAGWTEGNSRPPPALSVLGFGPCASRAGALRRIFANRRRPSAGPCCTAPWLLRSWSLFTPVQAGRCSGSVVPAPRHPPHRVGPAPEPTLIS